MKRLLVLSFLIGTSAYADLPVELNSMKCRNEVKSFIKKYDSLDSWTRTPDPQAGVYAFRSRAKSFATWVEVQSFSDPFVYIHSPEKIRTLKLDGKTCVQLINSDDRPFDFLSRSGVGLTDKELEVLVNSDKPSMVYIWSPEMVYSVQEIKIFKDVAKTMNLNFVPVFDTYLDTKEAKRAMTEVDPSVVIKRMKSLELFMRAGNVHYPMTFIVGGGDISKLIFGVKPTEELTQIVSNELASLQRKN